MPPYLAGRRNEEMEFRRLLRQRTILENMILTGLRGVGKTVLAETLKPIAIQEGWVWVGADASESVSVSEENLAVRLLTDLSVVTKSITITQPIAQQLGFINASGAENNQLSYSFLMGLYSQAPGLTSDKLKYILEFIWAIMSQTDRFGLVFAYDEAQNLADNADKEQYPLSLLLDVFQSIQRKGIPFMLMLIGLPTLFPKLVETRTYSERMFRVVMLDRLSEPDSRDAIVKPTETAGSAFRFPEDAVKIITSISGGYPYFIQFICKEVYDAWLQRFAINDEVTVPVEEIVRKLDSDFFAGRWSRATDRQRELLYVIALLESSSREFTVQEIVMRSRLTLDRGFSSSHVNQMLGHLSEIGMVYKNRYGKYSFAVPLMDKFVLRQMPSGPDHP